MLGILVRDKSHIQSFMPLDPVQYTEEAIQFNRRHFSCCHALNLDAWQKLESCRLDTI